MEGRGFGFVTFADGQCADAFLAHEAGHMIDGKSIEVSHRLIAETLFPSTQLLLALWGRCSGGFECTVPQAKTLPAAG
jgi:hypothetical protein